MKKLPNMVKGTSHIRVKDVEMGILVWIMQKRLIQTQGPLQEAGSQREDREQS